MSKVICATKQVAVATLFIAALLGGMSGAFTALTVYQRGGITPGNFENYNDKPCSALIQGDVYHPCYRAT